MKDFARVYGVWDEKMDYREIKLENGEECLLLIEEVQEIESVDERNQ